MGPRGVAGVVDEWIPEAATWKPAAGRDRGEMRPRELWELNSGSLCRRTKTAEPDGQAV